MHGNPGPLPTSQHLDWKKTHAELLRLKKSRARLDAELGEWLLRAQRVGVHQALGFASFAEYVTRMLGETPRWTRERLRVAEALENLPLTRAELETGELNWSAVRELTRVATAATESEWLRAAKQLAARQLESLVARRQPGDKPSDPAAPRMRRHVLHFEITADVLATFREAAAKLRREADSALSEEEVLLLMARQTLAGPSDTGKSSYQIAISVCDDCGRGFQQASGEPIEVGPEVVEAARCDSAHLGPLLAEAPQTSRATPPAAPRPRPAAPRPTAPRPAAATHVGRPGAPPARAKQSIPPRVRRQVMRRDFGRCVVPGCRHTSYVDIHHLTPRAEGGQHDPDQLVVLCGAHHRALHRGQLLVEGQVSRGLAFRHADGSTYGQVTSPASIEIYQQAFVALRTLGFRETEARRSLDQVRSEPGASDVESVVRRGLALLAA